MKTAAIAVASLLVAAPALAKGPKGGTPQTHHCELGGKEVQKTRKECAKAGGTWAKGAPAGAAAPKEPAKPALAPAPADAPAPTVK